MVNVPSFKSMFDEIIKQIQQVNTDFMGEINHHKNIIREHQLAIRDNLSAMRTMADELQTGGQDLMNLGDMLRGNAITCESVLYDYAHELPQSDIENFFGYCHYCGKELNGETINMAQHDDGLIDVCPECADIHKDEIQLLDAAKVLVPEEEKGE